MSYVLDKYVFAIRMLDELLDDSDEEEEASELVNQVFDEIGLDLNEQVCKGGDDV